MDVMFAPLSESNEEKLGPDVLDGYDEDDLYELQGTFRDLVTNEVDFGQVHSFIKDRLVFLSDGSDPNTCMSVYSDPPAHHTYQVQMIFTPPPPPTDTNGEDDKGSKSKKKPVKKSKKVQIAGIDADATSPIINGLAEFFLLGQLQKQQAAVATSDRTCPEEVEIAYKCFATVPRKPLGQLDVSSLSKCKDTNLDLSLSFQFVTLTPNHLDTVFEMEGVSKVEFRQCTLTGMEEWKPSPPSSSSTTKKGPTQLVFSCGQSEVPAITTLIQKSSSDDIFVNVKELDVLMHCLTEMKTFGPLLDALKKIQHVERLRIEYMGLDDDAWKVLCTALTNHTSFKYIHLAFTEKFADSVRRLTPERRTERSKAVLELVQNSPNLLVVDWPVFQQDEVIAEEIKKVLDARVEKME